MSILSFILNFPYTIIGLIAAFISVPRKINLNKNPYAIIFRVKSFWWAVGYIKHARAMAIGNMVLLGPNIEDKDLEHELIHVEQYLRVPIIYPFLYYVELFRKGYRDNKYEVEAYFKAGNLYRGK